MNWHGIWGSSQFYDTYELKIPHIQNGEATLKSKEELAKSFSRFDKLKDSDYDGHRCGHFASQYDPSYNEEKIEKYAG